MLSTLFYHFLVEEALSHLHGDDTGPAFVAAVGDPGGLLQVSSHQGVAEAKVKGDPEGVIANLDQVIQALHACRTCIR